MRILFLTQWFQPEPFFKGLPFVKALKARGHDVEVLTGFPHYPGGKIYSGYNIRPWKFKLMDDVPVHRVALFPSHDASGVKRILNYLSFGLTAAAFGPFLIKKPDENKGVRSSFLTNSMIKGYKIRYHISYI